MAYDFDKGVPVPTAVERVGVNIEMLKAMEPGESKWWSEEEAKKAARFYRVAKRLGIPILIRKVGAKDPRGVGVRMWRNDGAATGIVVAADPLAQAAERAARRVRKVRVVPTPKVKKSAKKGNSELLPAKHKASPKTNTPPKVRTRKLAPGVPSTPAALKRAGR